MERKRFLSAVTSLLAASFLPFKSWSRQGYLEDRKIRITPYLKRGDTIGITAPAGFVTGEGMQPALAVLENWGYNVKLGSTISKRHFTFGGTDEERLTDLQQMLDDPALQAVLCARGGYGAVRIVDALNWEKFTKHPKWVIGFSDITVLHNHIHTVCGVASLHAKMTNSFPAEWNKAEPIQVQTITSIHEALSGQKMNYSALPNVHNKIGDVKGLLVGVI